MEQRFIKKCSHQDHEDYEWRLMMPLKDLEWKYHRDIQMPCLEP